MFKIVAIMGIVLAVISGGFYWYYKTSQETIAELNQHQAALITSIEAQTETINSLQEDYLRANNQLAETNRAFSEARQQNRLLADRLSRHEIGALAKSKPVLVERTINNATAQVNRCFEILSGAELNEREKNATTPRAANSECPWLFDTAPNP
jgi:type II secretory pathway pseudopilin PulG